MIGSPLKLASSMIGSSASGGNRPRARSTLARTAARALSLSKSASNSRLTIAMLWRAAEFISFRPSMDCSSTSSGLTSRRSESSGLTPG